MRRRGSKSVAHPFVGNRNAPILLTDELADGFQAGQRVTITAVLIAGHLMAQKVELSGELNWLYWRDALDDG